MSCADFKDQLIDYAELAGEARARVDAHVSQCAECHEFLEALGTVDASLAARFSTAQEVSAGFAASVRRRVRQETHMTRPSFVPELLDLVGWAAIVALAGLVAWWVSPLLPASDPAGMLAVKTGWIAGAAFVLVAFFVGIHSFADLKH
jgi:anti-sigma factor RsiW